MFNKILVMKKFILSLLICFGYVSLSAQSNGNYQIKFLEVNRDNSDYAVALLDENKIVFTSEGNADSERGNRNPRKKLYIGDMDFDGEILNVTKIDREDSNKSDSGIEARLKPLRRRSLEVAKLGVIIPKPYRQIILERKSVKSSATPEQQKPVDFEIDRDDRELSEILKVLFLAGMRFFCKW